MASKAGDKPICHFIVGVYAGTTYNIGQDQLVEMR